jgi:hypothetical protein
MSKFVLQEQIAALMSGANSMGGDNYGGQGTTDHRMTSVNGLPDPDSSDSGADVVDGRSNQNTTKLKECSAVSCRFNADGCCSKTVISVNKTGGCADYSAESENYDQADVHDEEVIQGISHAMPEQPDHPSNHMTSKYMPSFER